MVWVFWRQIFYSQESHTNLSNTWVLFLLAGYTTENKHLIGILWTSLPYAQKRWLICSLLRKTWLVLFDWFEWVKTCRFAVVSKQAKKKTRKKQKRNQNQTQKRKFLVLGDLVRSSNVIFIEGHSLFLR